jgi:hypothetical protein
MFCLVRKSRFALSGERAAAIALSTTSGATRLTAGGRHDGAARFRLATGMLPAFLGNAPTYLVFCADELALSFAILTTF